MSKGGGSVSSISVPTDWRMDDAVKKLSDMYYKSSGYGDAIYQYGMGRASKYADPVLNQFLDILGLGGGGAAGAAPMSPATEVTSATGAVTVPSMSDIISQLNAAYGHPGQQGPGQAQALQQLRNEGINVDTGAAQGISGSYANIPSPGTPEFQAWLNNTAVDARTRMSQGQGGSVAGAVPTAGATGSKGSPFTSILSSSMMQLPIQATQQQYDALVKQIRDTVPPGPQQSALLTNAANQRMQGLGMQAYSMVQGMVNSLLAERGAGFQGASSAQGFLGQAIGTAATEGGLASSMMQMQMQAQMANQQMEAMAQQSGNSLLGGIFKTIGGLAGYGMGEGWLGKIMGMA